MSDELAVPTVRFGDMAMELRAPLCRTGTCTWQGSWVDAHDRTDTTYADESAEHAARTGHHKIGDLKITYSPGEMVDLRAVSRRARRPLGRRDA
jgi:hypothetical protein